MRYKVLGSAEMTDHPMVRAVASPPESMVLGVVGDSGERSDAHPVQEIESN